MQHALESHIKGDNKHVNTHIVSNQSTLMCIAVHKFNLNLKKTEGTPLLAVIDYTKTLQLNLATNKQEHINEWYNGQS